MTVKIREWKKGDQVGFEVDIRFTYPDGTPFRRRFKAPVESKSAAKRWGEAREAVFLRAPSPSERQPEEPKKEVPTLNDFGPLHREPRAGEQAEGEWHRSEGEDPEEAPVPAVGAQAPR